jgi:biopolymer transport protein ExbD
MNSLIDLTFLLLVTFMVTLPAIQHGVEIMLPRAKAEQVDRKEEDKPTVIEVQKVDTGYAVYLNGDKIGEDRDGQEAALEELERRLKDMVEAAQMSEKEVRVHVRGDKTLDYDTMMKVVAVVQRSKVHKMGLLTENK